MNQPREGGAGAETRFARYISNPSQHGQIFGPYQIEVAHAASLKKFKMGARSEQSRPKNESIKGTEYESRLPLLQR
jgi:hypothetical protein